LSESNSNDESRVVGGRTTVLKSYYTTFLVSDIGRAARRYFVVGGVSALADWAVFALMLYVFELHYLLAATVSFILATALNYLLSVRYVFGNGRRDRNQRIFLLYAVSIVGVGFNLGLLTVGINFLDLHPMLSKVLATGAVFGWNFVARYYLVFQK
jgi:putative flippase GtrA